MAAKNFVFRQVRQLLVHRRDAATAASALTANAAISATTITVASIAGLASGDSINVGTGEDLELNKINGAPSGFTVTLAWPLTKAHIIGELAKRVITYDHGDPTDNGITVTIEADNVDVGSAVRRTILCQLRGYVRAFVEGEWAACTMYNIAAAFGMLVSRVTGAGTPANPYQVITGGDELGEDTDASVTVNGVLVDGSFFNIDLHGVDFDHMQVKFALARAQLASVPFKAKATSQVVLTSVDPAYTVNTTLRATKGKVFDAPSEIGLYSPNAGVNTTLSVAAAAGANSFTVVASAGAAVGDPVMFGTAENAEVHFIDTIPDATHITIRGKTLRAFAIGAVVVEQQRVPFAGVDEAGVSLAVTGDKRDVKLATRRMEAGSIPGTTIFTLSWMLVDILLTNLAYALGVPQSAIASGRLTVGNNIGTSDIGQVYSRGLMQDGSTVELDACGCSQQIQGFALKLDQKSIAKQPLTLRPASCITLRQWL